MNDPPSPMPTAFEILQLEPLGDDRFRACVNQDNLLGVVYGGQFLAQALAAAKYSLPKLDSDWPANSLSGFFLAAGRLQEPLEFAVTRCHDGRSFAVRRVTARQGSRNVFEMTCSFHQSKPGTFIHQFEEVGSLQYPEMLLSLKAFAMEYETRLPSRSAAIFRGDFPIELRLTDPEAFFRSEPLREFWFRIPSAPGLPGSVDHQALLAFMSDYWLPAAIGASYGGNGTIQNLLSVNHSLWFHAPTDTRDWLFYRSSSPWADHGRGLAHGRIFDRAGRLVATAMQEALLRFD